MKALNGMHLIKDINKFDVKLLKNKPYNLKSMSKVIENSNLYSDALTLTLMYNVLEIVNHYGLVSFTDTYNGTTIEHNSRIQEVRLFIRGLLDAVGTRPPMQSVHHVIDLNEDEDGIELFLDVITTVKLHKSYIKEQSGDYMIVTDSGIRVDDINTFINQFNDAVIKIVTTYPPSLLDENALTLTISRNIRDMVDMDLIADIMDASWAIVKHYDKFDNYEHLFAIRDYLNDRKMKFVPYLKQSCFLINDKLDLEKLEKIFDEVYYVDNISKVPVEYHCAIMHKLTTHMDWCYLCSVKEYRQLLKFNLQFGDSGFNSGKYVVLLNYELASSLI